MSAQLLGVSLSEVGAVLRLERDAWSMAIRPRQATIEYVPPPPMVGGVSIRRGNGALSRKEGMVNGQMTKASSQLARPPPLPLLNGGVFWT